MTGREFSSRRAAAADRNIKERNYWLDKLSGDWVKATFPYDFKNSKGERRLEQLTFTFPGEMYPLLMKLSNESDHRLFMILTAALTALLYKYTGNRDIILGVPIYKQERDGDFINTVLALRNECKDDTTFKDLLLKVRQTVIEAVRHQNYPIETLVFKLDLTSPGKDFPLFDIALLLENVHDKHYIESIKYHMLFCFLKNPRGLDVVVEYNALLYREATVERILSHLRQLLQGVVFNVDMQIQDVDIRSEEEKERLLVEFNSTEASFPKDKTIHRLFEEQVARTPDKIALTGSKKGTEGNVSLTYRQLNEKSNRLAHLLRKKGVAADSIVAIIMESSVRRIIAIIGVLKAGGAYLPIEPGFPRQRISSVLADSGVSLLLIGETLLADLTYTLLRNIAAGKAEPVRTPVRGQITDFDRLPILDRTLVDYRKYHRYIGEAMAKHKVTIQATRGCPYKCAFCHKIWPKRHVARSAENIFREIQYCYNAGIRRFAFIDDIFNLDVKNSSRLLQTIIKQRMDVQIFFPNGLRADILTKDYIDLMVEAGTVNLDVALETGSPRIQKLISKNLNLEKFYENTRYITEKYPQVILEMEIMLGFPTETEEEAMMTLDFLKGLKWVHFPDLHVLKIFPTSDMARLALENGVSKEAIERSANLAFHELPETLPFSKAFAREFQSRFMTEYFLLKERLVQVIPAQARILAEDELVDKYDSYLPAEIKSFPDILSFAGITMEDLGNPVLLPEGWKSAPDFNERVKKYFPVKEKAPDAFSVLLLDISQFFTSEKEKMLHTQNDEPLGLMSLMSCLNERFGARIKGRIFKSGVDFDSFHHLQDIIREVQPDLVGIRALSYYKEFFHTTVSKMRKWGVTAPIISGGPYATSDYTFILQDSNLDLVVLGEGELTIVELVEKMMANEKKLPEEEVLKKIPGIAFVTAGDKSLLRRQEREVLVMDHLWEELVLYPGENPHHLTRPGDLLYLISTSGSAGKPKSVMLEHRNLVNLLHFELTKEIVDFSLRVLQFASIGFDVSAQEIFSTLLGGGRLYLITGEIKNDVFQLFDLIRENKISIVFLPPSFLKFIFSDSQYREKFPTSIKHIIAAGEQLVVTEPMRNYLKRNRVHLHNHYGPTEAHVVTTFTVNPGGEIPETPPIGKPISNTRIHILDKKGEPMPIGVAGELYIAGASVGRGYLNRPEFTNKKFRITHSGLSYNTGDLARWLPDGNIEFIGRKDYQVKIRGYRIELGEIENRLMEIDGIKEAVVIDRGEEERYLCAYIVSGKEVAASELRNRLSGSLPDYMIPAYFMPLDKIPLTASGKVDRKKLPEAGVKPVGNYAAPGDAVEEKLAGIWADILGINKDVIGIDDNFFELGGHSLRATILISRVHKAFNVKAGLGEIFDQPTIRGLAQCIREFTRDKYLSIEPLEKRDYYALSSAQKRLYIQQQASAHNVSYNMLICITLEGELNRGKLAGVFGQLISRHESMRTSFEMLEEEPVQRIHRENSGFRIREYNAAAGDPVGIIKNFLQPFDLSKAPLLRVGLIRVEEQEHILLVAMHHIISDGISLGILSREFMALYGGKTLPRLTVQYKDFSLWQNRLFESKELEKQEEYWLKQFEGDIPVLHMPTDFPRPPVQQFEGARHVFYIDERISAKIKELVSDTNTTLFIVLLTVCNILLWKYTRQEDIVVGSGVAGRKHADLENVIGMFVNMLAMRSRPQPGKTFAAFLAEVDKNTLNAFANQDFQFEELVKKLNLEKNPARSPLFDVVVQIQNMEIPELEITGLKLKPYDYEVRTSRFDLVIGGIENNGTITMYITYSTALFSKSYMKDLQKHLMEIFEQVLENNRIKLEEIVLSTELSTAAPTIPREDSMFQF